MAVAITLATFGAGCTSVPTEQADAPKEQPSGDPVLSPTQVPAEVDPPPADPNPD